MVQSIFFKKYKKLYYANLSAYHNDGDVFAWLDFFLDGVIQTAEDGAVVSKKIRAIRDKDMEKIQALAKRESESSIKMKLEILERMDKKDKYDRKYIYRRYFNAFID